MTVGQFDEEHNPQGACLAYHYVIPCGKTELHVKVRATSEKQALLDVQRWLDDDYALCEGYSKDRLRCGMMLEGIGGVVIHGGPPSIEWAAVYVRGNHRVVVLADHLEEAYP